MYLEFLGPCLCTLQEGWENEETIQHSDDRTENTYKDQVKNVFSEIAEMGAVYNCVVCCVEVLLPYL